MSAARLSVIICTHERPDELADCLDALADCPTRPQVIVVDSGSAVPCEPVVAARRDAIARLEYVYVAEPGLSRARNIGMARATAPIIAFLDDDATPQPGWDQALLAAFRDHPDVGCVGGACVPRFAGPRPRWLSDRLLALSSITRFGSRGREPRSSAEWPFGANMAFRRAALEQAGGFSEALGRTGTCLLSGEDSDMVARVLKARWRIWLEPGCVVLHAVHPERLRSRFYWRRLWWAGISRARQPAAATTLRLIVAVPIRTLLWALTRDRIYMYRLAESAGYLAVLSGAVRQR
jgi:glucosyl-dolichyl phosphate glucuronosyltransferase